MKYVIAALLGGGTLFAADLPPVGVNECEIVSTEVVRGEPTMIDPTPAAESLSLVVYCGQAVPTDTGGVRTERALKVIEVDIAQAEVLAQAGAELLADDDVYMSEGNG